MGHFLRRLALELRMIGQCAFQRPLHARELARISSLTIVLGTLYCAAYCRLAFPPMHSGTMPVTLSVWWATTSLLPWLLAFEILKRRIPAIGSSSGKAGFIAGLCAVTLTLTAAAEQLANFGMNEMAHTDWRVSAANQLQPLLMFMIAAGIWAAGQARIDVPNKSGGAAFPLLPPLHQIDWIRAAGNYVELRCNGQLLIRRITMRAAEAATREADFVRIHRSLIVRGNRIAGFVRGRRDCVELTTGEKLPVGDRYRSSVERFVPLSRNLGTSAH